MAMPREILESKAMQIVAPYTASENGNGGRLGGSGGGTSSGGGEGDGPRHTAQFCVVSLSPWKGSRSDIGPTPAAAFAQ
jgi:hypothetical protein